MPETEDPAGADAVTTTGWRYRLGLALFMLPIPLFFLIPVIVPLLGYSAARAAAIIAAALVVSEVIWFASIPLLGKAGFKALKVKYFGWLRLDRRSLARFWRRR